MRELYTPTLPYVFMAWFLGTETNLPPANGRVIVNDERKGSSLFTVLPQKMHGGAQQAHGKCVTRVGWCSGLYN
jgi:hypothetical protein